MKKIYTNSLISLLVVFMMLNNDLIAKDAAESAEIVPVANFQYNPSRAESGSRTFRVLDPEIRQFIYSIRLLFI